MINTGTSLTVLEDKGTINFKVNDIFRGMKFAFNLDRPFCKTDSLIIKVKQHILVLTTDLVAKKTKEKS